MTTRDNTGLDGLKWMVVATALGSIIGKVLELDAEKTIIRIYDPCWITTRPEIYWTDPLDYSKRWTEQEAKTLGYMIEDREMVEAEGDLITEYLPIRPNTDLNKSYIEFYQPQMIFGYRIENPEEIEAYVDQLMGRVQPKRIDD